ncbi:hypothetical protein EDD76_10170 [Kineothrix alysoides]|uniref:Uncharacterized protein n=1 Tax=Kineothrix alysoides TaxID=1469948 RepID=A0A4R1R607_9FIRM|nr:hypothetical protein [Kineothrix alysoides]TCL60973.1 hypothetical protein EDD76_10170 [Kineothrix alysoides]
MKIIKFTKVLTVLTAISIFLTAGLLSGIQLEQNRLKQEEQLEAVEDIAVVNLDEGIYTDEGKINYAALLMEFPSDNFVSTGLEEARTGIYDGSYAAYIIVPASFSANAESINSIPQKSIVEYAMNPNLKSVVSNHIIAEIKNFESIMGRNMSYMYVEAILREFHGVQDSAKVIMKNDEKDMQALLELDPSNLIEFMELPEPERVKDEIQDIDLSDIYSENQKAVKETNESAKEAITKGKGEFETVRSGSEKVTKAAEFLTSEAEKINLMTDGSGMPIYQPGIEEIENYVTNYNEVADGQKNELKERLGWEKSGDVAGIVKTSGRADNQETVSPPLLVSDILQAKVDQRLSNMSQTVTNTNNEYNEILNSNMSKIIEELDGLRAIIVEASEKDREKEEEGGGEEGGGEEGGGEEGGGEEGGGEEGGGEEGGGEEGGGEEGGGEEGGGEEGGGEEGGGEEGGGEEGGTETVEGRMAFMEGEGGGTGSEEGGTETGDDGEDDEDDEDGGDDEDDGEDDEDDGKDGEGDEDDGDDGEDDGKDDEDDEEYVPLMDYEAVLASIDSLIVQLDEMPECEITIENETIDMQEESEEVFGELIDDIDSMKAVKQESIVKVFNEGIIKKIEKRSEEEKKKLSVNTGKLTDDMTTYLGTLEKFDPFQYYDEGEIDNSLMKINDNLQTLESKLNDKNMDYRDFISDVFMTAEENTTELQTKVNDTYQETANNVTSTMESVKTDRVELNEQNKGLLNDFSNKLPYTRLGNVEYTQAYDFIVSPLNSEDKSVVKKAVSLLYDYGSVKSILIVMISLLVVEGLIMLAGRLVQDNKKIGGKDYISE